MQISLRSQMIAGSTALVGATAIAMTPVAPAVSIPSISTAKLGVAMAAFVNPLAEVLGTGNMILNYVLNGNYSTDPASGGLSNWGPYSNLGPGYVLPDGTVLINDGAIGPVTNAGLTFGLLPDLSGYGPAINAVGIIPDFLGSPFPILTQVVNNQLGYITLALEAVGAVAGAAVNVLWTPVQLAFEITTLVLSGNIALIPTAIAEAVSQVVTGFQIAAGAVVNSEPRSSATSSPRPRPWPAPSWRRPHCFSRLFRVSSRWSPTQCRTPSRTWRVHWQPATSRARGTPPLRACWARAVSPAPW